MRLGALLMHAWQSTFWASQHSGVRMSERHDFFSAKSAHIHGLLLSGNVIIAIIARPLSLTDSLPTALSSSVIFTSGPGPVSQYSKRGPNEMLFHFPFESHFVTIK